jgi:hypothetical protein
MSRGRLQGQSGLCGKVDLGISILISWLDID